MAMPRRTLRDIRTISGRVDRVANPYMAYMQITCLEMEKVRKGRERASMLQRMQLLDNRLRDIEAEKAMLLRALAERAPAPAEPAGPLGRSAPPRAAGGLRLRY